MKITIELNDEGGVLRCTSPDYQSRLTEILEHMLKEQDYPDGMTFMEFLAVEAWVAMAVALKAQRDVDEESTEALTYDGDVTFT